MKKGGELYNGFLFFSFFFFFGSYLLLALGLFKSEATRRQSSCQAARFRCKAVLNADCIQSAPRVPRRITSAAGESAHPAA